MDDAQFPPEAGDAKSTAARRSGARLSDTEAVATARLDMFGDNSLRDSLAGAAPGEAPPIAEQGAAADQAPYVDAEVQNAQPAIADLPPAGAASLPALPLSPGLQGHDAAIDAAADVIDDAERTAGEREQANSSAPSPTQLGLPNGDRLSRPEPAPAAAAAYIAASPIFSALDEAEKDVEAERNGEAATPGPFGSAFMMPPGSTEHDGLADVSKGPLNAQPRFRDELIKKVEGSASPTGAEPALFPSAQDAVFPAVQDAGEPLPEPAEVPPLTELSGDLPGTPPPAYPELSEASPFPEGEPAIAEPAEAAPLPEPAEAPPYHEPGPPPTLDAAAKIAAEANATAEALENLKRLLENRLPDLERERPAGEPDRASAHAVPSPSIGGSLRIGGFHAAAPTLAGTSAPMLPLPLPPERSSGRGVYVLGFLAGLGLSLMTGLVLYLVINTG